MRQWRATGVRAQTGRAEAAEEEMAAQRKGKEEGRVCGRNSWCRGGVEQEALGAGSGASVRLPG